MIDYVNSRYAHSHTHFTHWPAALSSLCSEPADGENFQKFLAVVPEVESLFRQRVNVRTSERLRTIPFFRNVRENKPFCKLDLLGALFTFEEFAPG